MSARPATLVRSEPLMFGARSIQFLRRHAGLGRDDRGRPWPGAGPDQRPTDPLLCRVLDYWTAKRGNRFAPARADIDPIDLTPALGWLALVDVQHDAQAQSPRFRFRLHGTGLVAASGVDMTGRYVDEFPEPDYRALMLGALTQVVETRAPWIGRRARVIDDERRAFEAVILPLSDDGRRVTIALGGLRYL